MRSICAFLIGLLLAAALGCTNDGPRSKNWFGSLPAFRGPTGSDVVQLEWGLIERPVGDHYLNGDLWSLANEQVIPLERKDALETNGLRIAQIGGLLPAEFMELLHSERSNPAPQRRQVRADHAAVLTIGPVRERCDFARPLPPGVHGIMGLWPNVMGNLQFGIAVTPSLADDNKVRLSFTPQVQQGEPKVAIRPAEDGSGWTAKPQVKTEKYGQLSWDVSVGPNDYLLIGCRFQSNQCYGKECFVRIDEPRPVQRLLVIRAARQVMDAAGTETAEENVPPRTVAAVAQGALR